MDLGVLEGGLLEGGLGVLAVGAPRRVEHDDPRAPLLPPVGQREAPAASIDEAGGGGGRRAAAGGARNRSCAQDSMQHRAALHEFSGSGR